MDLKGAGTPLSTWLGGRVRLPCSVAAPHKVGEPSGAKERGDSRLLQKSCPGFNQQMLLAPQPKILLGFLESFHAALPLDGQLLVGSDPLLAIC